MTTQPNDIEAAVQRIMLIVRHRPIALGMTSDQLLEQALRAELGRVPADAAVPTCQQDNDKSREWAWGQVREQVGTKGWTVGESSSYFGFFCWGWQYRDQLEKQRAPSAEVSIAPPLPQVAGKRELQWMPIETAPKDGTEIILYHPTEVFEGKAVPERVTSGAWIEWEHRSSEYHSTTGEYLGTSVQDSGASWGSWDGGFREESPPTHWARLPAAPIHGIGPEQESV